MKLTLEEANRIMSQNDGNLNLSWKRYTQLPDGLVVRGHMDITNTSITVLPNDLIVMGSLYLEFTKVEFIPVGLVVGGSLNIRHTKIKSLPNDLIVHGTLNLNYTPITSLPSGLIVQDALYINYTQITELPDDLVVGGYLPLYYTNIKKLPNPLVISECIGLNDIQFLSLPDDLITGSTIYSNGRCIKPNLKNGDYIPGKYLYVEDTLTHIKYDKQIDNYTYYIGKIPGKNVLFDGEYYAHCKTFKQGVQDITFKHTIDRGSEQYANLTLDSVLSIDDAVMMYCIITGAEESYGNTVVRNLLHEKKSYTVKEIIDITADIYYSHILRNFFIKF